MIIVLLCGAALLALLPQLTPYGKLQLPNEGASDKLQRRLEIDVGGVGDSSRHVLIIQADEETLAKARSLLQEELSLEEGLAGLKNANLLLRKEDATDQDKRRALELATEVARLLVKKASVQKRGNSGKRVSIAELDEETGTTSFPACEDMPIPVCEQIIRKGLRELGLPWKRFRLEKRPKRDEGDEGFNKVVILTDLLAEFVAEDPTYPYEWHGTEGSRAIGPWNCVGLTPEACCDLIKQDVQDPDATRTDEDGGPLFVECEITVPVGGEGNVDPKRIIVQESPDGRVHEIPVTG